MSLNRFEFIGNIGKIVVHSGERSRLEVSIAINGGYKDKETNEWVDQVDWINLQSWNPSVIERVQAKYASGDMVFTDGRVKPWSKGEGDSAKYGINFDIDTFRMLARAEKNKKKDGDDS